MLVRGRAGRAALHQRRRVPGGWLRHGGCQRVGWLRPAGTHARCLGKIIAILDQMERDVSTYERLDLAQIRGVGALQFLRLKLPSVARATVGLDPTFNPFDGRPRLEGWYKSLARKKMFRVPLIKVE